jgi:hypothetical protein
MFNADALLTIAEMAIGLAGFSAVVAAFARSGELSPTDRTRFVWLFSTAFVAALLAFVPILLSEAALSGPTLWRWSSGVMIATWLVSIGLVAYSDFRDSHDPSVPPPDFSRGVFLFVPSVVNLVLQIMNFWGEAWEPSSAVYIFGTLVWLYAASLVFMAIVLERRAG